MPFGIRYRQGGEAVASYDWVDLTSGAGYKRFYPCGAIHSSGAVYFLSPKLLDGATLFAGDWGVSTENDGAGSELTLNFDVTFGKPATIAAADAFFNFTIKVPNTKVSTSTITVYHVTAGGTATSLGATTGKSRTPVSATYTSMRECIKVTLTKKSFGVGEKLRVTYSSSLTDGDLIIFHDPNSRLTIVETTSASIGTDFTADIPFHIDL